MKLVLGIIVSLFFSSVLFAQTATLRGTVTDDSGAIVPGAKITLTANSGTVNTAVAGADGSYSFTGIAPGDYVAQASAPDLATPPLKLTIRPGVQTLNLQLKVAAVAQQVTVEDRAVTVTPEPANNASATVLAGDDLQALSDNPDDLIDELIAIAGPGAGPGGASIFIDGFSSGQLSSRESIREIRINQNPFSAEYDRIGTGRIEILTRPGTNQFHGSGFFNFGNDFLISRAAHSTATTHTIQATETAVFAENMVNEVRFQLFRSSNEITPNTIGPSIQVLGAFNGGASPEGHSFDTQSNYEFQDYMSVLHGQHSWRFGVRLRRQADDNISPQNFQGTFIFSGGAGPVLDANNQPVLDSTGQPILTPITSIERYRRTLLFQKIGLTPSQIASLGGGANQFSIIAGDPKLSVSQFDAGAFVSDDWKIRPALSMSLGVRYGTQTNIRDRRDISPRIGVAWGFAPKTVVRAGFGIFYDRFGLANTVTALRYNGIRQQQFDVTNPDFL